MKHLTITYGGLDLFDGPASKFSWSESGSGGIKIEAEPLRASNGKLNGGSAAGGALSKILSAVSDARDQKQIAETPEEVEDLDDAVAG